MQTVFFFDLTMDTGNPIFTFKFRKSLFCFFFFFSDHRHYEIILTLEIPLSRQMKLDHVPILRELSLSNFYMLFFSPTTFLKFSTNIKLIYDKTNIYEKVARRRRRKNLRYTSENKYLPVKIFRCQYI